MMGRAHLAISTGVTISILGLADYKITVPVVAVTVVSSLLPDIDEPNSLIVSRALPTSLLRHLQGVLIALAAFVYFYGTELAPWNTVIAILAALVSFMPTRTLRNVMMILIGACLILFGQSYIPWSTIIGCLLIICALVPHRGITHSLYGVLGWTALLYFSTYNYGHALWTAGGLSYLIHLIADALTNHGIRPLPPFDFRLKLGLMSTGTMKGTLVENLCIGLTFVLVWFVFFRRVNLEHFIF